MKRKKDKKSRAERNAPSQPTFALSWQAELANLKLEGGKYDKAAPKTHKERVKWARAIPHRVLKGWRFQISDTLGQYHLSVSLHPRGRSSTEEDWGFLGKVLAVLGVPEDHIKPFGIDRDGKDIHSDPEPGAVHHFMWSK